MFFLHSATTKSISKQKAYERNERAISKIIAKSILGGGTRVHRVGSNKKAVRSQIQGSSSHLT
jgi:hypothetical protein